MWLRRSAVIERALPHSPLPSCSSASAPHSAIASSSRITLAHHARSNSTLRESKRTAGKDEWSNANRTPNRPSNRFRVEMPSAPATRNGKGRANGRGTKMAPPQKESDKLLTFHEKVLDGEDPIGAQQMWNELRQDRQLQYMHKDDLARYAQMLCKRDDASPVLDVMKDIAQAQPRRFTIVVSTLYEARRYEVLLDAIKTIFKMSPMGSSDQRRVRHSPWLRHLSADQVRNLLAFACMAAVELPGQQWSRLVSSVIPLGEKVDGLLPPPTKRHTKSPEKALQVAIPQAIQVRYHHDAAKFQLAEKAYRHLKVALEVASLTFEEDRESNNVFSLMLYRFIASEDYAAVEQALAVFEEGHQDWLKSSFTSTEGADSWNVSTWGYLFNALIVKHRLSLAQQVWNAFTRCKPKEVPVHPVIWNSLLQAYGEIADWNRVSQIWEMAKSTMEPDDYMMTTMMKNLFKARQPFEAMLLFEQLKAHCAANKQTMRNAPVNTYILGLSYSDRIDEAAQVVTQMAQQTDSLLPLPNMETLNVMLRAYSRHGTVDNITDVLRMMVALDLTPDTITFTTVLDSLSRMGLGDSVEHVLELMKASDVEVNSITLSAVIKMYVLSEDEATLSLENGFRLLQHMEARGPAPTAVTYTSLMTCLLRRQRVTAEYMQRNPLPLQYDVESAKEMLHKYDVDLDLILAHFPGHFLALLLYEHMQLMRVMPNRKTYHTLLGECARLNEINAHGAAIDPVTSALLQRQMLKVTMKLLGSMAESIAPNGSTISTLIGGLQTIVDARLTGVYADVLECIGRLASITVNDEYPEGRLGARLDEMSSVVLQELQSKRNREFKARKENV